MLVYVSSIISGSIISVQKQCLKNTINRNKYQVRSSELFLRGSAKLGPAIFSSRAAGP